MEQNILKSWLNGDLDKYADNNNEVYNILENPTKTKINTELYEHGFNDCLKILRLINNKRQEIGLPGFNDFRLPFKNIKHQFTVEEKLLIELENYTKKILVYQKDLGESYIIGYYDCLSAWNYKDEACSYVLGCVISGKPVVNPEDIMTKPLSDETTKEILRAMKVAKKSLGSAYGAYTSLAAGNIVAGEGGRLVGKAVGKRNNKKDRGGKKNEDTKN